MAGSASRIYALAGAPATWHQRVIAATLLFDAVASSVTAGHLLGIMGRTDGSVHVTVGRGQRRRKRSGVVIRQAVLTRTDVRRIENIPVTAPNRTLLDIAAALPVEQVEAAVDKAILLGLTTPGTLLSYLDDHGRPVLRRIAEDRLSGVPESELERLFERKLKRSGLPPPVRQYRVGRRRLDYAYPDRKIAIELDGFAAHSSAEALHRDATRRNELVLLGWHPFHFTWRDVNDRWPATERTIREALQD